MAEYELKLNLNADSTALDELISKLDELKTREEETNNNTISPDGDTSGLDDIDGKLGDIIDKEEESSSTPLMDIASLTIIADKLSDIGSRAEAMSQNLAGTTATIDKLSIQSGVSTESLTKMTNSLTSAKFDSSSALSYIKTLDQIGVSSNNLEKSAKGLKTIGSALQLDPSTVTGMANELSVLGVNMNNVSESYNALAYANANTVGGMQNYYSFLRKYDAEFAEMGLNVDQASVLIAGATKKFGGGRAAISGLNSVLKESNGDLRAMEQALGLQPGALTNASQATAQYAGQLEAMGAAGGNHLTFTQRLTDMWNDMALTLAPIIEPLGSVAGLLGQIGGVAINVNALTTFFTTLKESERIAGMMETLKLAIDGVRNAESIGAGVKAFFTTILGLEEGATLASALGFDALAASEGLALAPILLLIGAIIILVGVLWYLYNNNEQVRQAIDGLIGALQQFIGEVMNAIQPIIQFVQQALAQFMQLFPGVVGALQPAFNFIVYILGAIFSFGINILTRAVMGWITVFRTLIAGVRVVFNAVKGVISAAFAAWNALTSRVRTIVNNIISPFKSILGKIQGAMSGVKNAITKPFTDAYNTIKPVIDTIKAAWDMLKSVGAAGVVTGSAGIAGIGVGVADVGSNNSNIINNLSNSNTGVTNINISGIIEESASEYIVKSINDEISKQRVIRGDG